MCRGVVNWAVALSFAAAIAAPAQLSSHLDVTMDVKGGCPAGDIEAVMDGNDTRTIGLKRVGDCHWTGPVKEGRFSSKSYFSLRLANARTECQHAEPDKQRPGFATLHFYCCAPGPLNVVRIRSTPAMSVSYLRDVREIVPGQLSKHRMARHCVEEGIFDPHRLTIDHVQFGMEKIHLQIGAETPDPQAIGLRVNDLPLALKKGYEPLSFDGVVYRLIVQRVNDGDLSLNAIDLDVVKLEEVKLEKLEVWVTK